MDSQSPNPISNRTQWILIGAAAFAALLIIFLANDNFYADDAKYIASSTPVRENQKIPPITVKIDFGNGVVRTFRGSDAIGMSAFEALQAAASVGIFKVTTNSHGQIVSIAGIVPAGGRSWMFYLNNSPASEVPGNIDVHSDDVLMFRYE